MEKDKETISLRKIIVYYIQHWRVFLVAALLSLIPAVAYLLLYPKTYEMMATIKIQEDKNLGNSGVGLGEAAGLMKSFGLGSAGGGVVNMDDELATLLSNQLNKEMVLDLGVNVSYEKPFSYYKLYDDAPVVVVPDSATQRNLDAAISFRLQKKGDGPISVKMKKSGEKFTFPTLPASLELPAGKLTIDYRTPADKQTNFKLDISVRPAAWVAEENAKSFTIEEYSKSSNTIELSCTDHSKKRGVDMLNTLISAYNQRAERIKKEEGEQSMNFLEGRIRNILTELNATERKIENYKIKNKMTDMEYDVQFYAENMKDIRQKLIELESQKHVIDLIDAYIRNPENKYNLIPALLTAQEGEKGGAISSYNEALIERERVRRTSKTDNPLLEGMDKQLDKLRESVHLTIGNAKKSLEFSLTDLRKKENEIFVKMGNVPTYEREYIDFKRQQEILQGVYLILLQKKEEVALSLGQNRDRAQVIDYAYVKKSPIGPRKLFAAIFMVFFTILIPIGYLACKEQLVALIAEYKASKQK